MQLLKEENREAIWCILIGQSLCECGGEKCRDFGVDICVYLIKRVSIIFLRDKLTLKKKTPYIKPTS